MKEFYFKNQTKFSKKIKYHINSNNKIANLIYWKKFNF